MYDLRQEKIIPEQTFSEKILQNIYFDMQTDLVTETSTLNVEFTVIITHIYLKRSGKNDIRSSVRRKGEN